MFDPYLQSLHAAAAHERWAPALTFAAGFASSVGPCTAPRFIAAASLSAAGDRRRSGMSLAAFVCGLVCTYASFGIVASLLSRASAVASTTYALVAAALLVGGFRMLWRDQASCEHDCKAAQHAGMGAAFLLGASSALVLSPCCTPLVVAIVAFTSATGDALYGSALLACFALGHAVPLYGIAAGAGGMKALLRRPEFGQASSLVSASLMLGLGAYYAVLA